METNSTFGLHGQWDYANPTRVMAGPDLPQLLDHALQHVRARSGRRRVLLISGQGALTSDFRARVRAYLERHCNVVTFSTQTLNSPLAAMEACVAAIAGEPVDAIVAVGGGAVIDLAKAAACYQGRNIPEDIETILERDHDRIPTRTLPLIAIPTTAGTGSEVTPYAVLTSRANRKLFAISRNLYPDVGVICSESYATVSRKTIAEVGMDAVAHALEALWAKKASPVSDALAIEALTRFDNCLVRYYRCPTDPALGYEVALGACFAGLAFAAAYTSLCHALSFPLSELLGLSHGKCCALTIAETAAFNSDYESGALQRLCRALRIESLADLPEYLHGLRTGLDDFDTLASVGFLSKSIPAIAMQARESMTENNAKYADQDALQWILRQARARADSQTRPPLP